MWPPANERCLLAIPQPSFSERNLKAISIDLFRPVTSCDTRDLVSDVPAEAKGEREPTRRSHQVSERLVQTIWGSGFTQQ